MFQTTQHTFIEIEGTLYLILRIISESHKPVIETWKEHLGADRVFRKEGQFFFVEEVKEAVIITDDEISGELTA